ncbi:F390 synthetase-related protein [Salipiger bermudensis]|uniref:F390 synthetase-related protein n=1 Tax=Salipiger bermudensis TaxID=344736 RepID=UPI001CD75276|nr:F390 synthetase-related protein [Salipiger bermudensis]MCA0962362.1 adenylate synthase [Salipiger bermudensis]
MSITAFLQTRYGRGLRSRAEIEAHQSRAMARFRRRIMPRSPFYQDHIDTPLHALPRMDKARLMESFTAINTCGIDREEAFEVALEAERSRDFSPMIGRVGVGLSTGTSGQRGLFLTTPRERRLWAAIMSGRFWPDLRRRQRVAFFMRADNALYRSLSNPLLRFEFFDVTQGMDAHLQGLGDFAPTVLIAPAGVLSFLARAQSEGRLAVQPQRVVSVAESLGPSDRAAIARAFRTQVDEVYQATEGVLAFTCPAGNLHLNEAWMRIERDVVDPESGAFCPVIHDFTRESLPLLNYRLNDVLVPDETPCPCGSACSRIARIEGREDDMLWWKGPDGPRLIPAEAIRTMLASLDQAVGDYRVVQHADALTISLEQVGPDTEAALRARVSELARQFRVAPPTLVVREGLPPDSGFKRRRIRVATDQMSLAEDRRSA